MKNICTIGFAIHSAPQSVYTVYIDHKNALLYIILKYKCSMWINI